MVPYGIEADLRRWVSRVERRVVEIAELLLSSKHLEEKSRSQRSGVSFTECAPLHLLRAPSA
jgi:hypothetical protein